MGTHKPHSARQRPPPPTPTNMESYRHSNDQVADDKSNVLAAVSSFFMTQSGAKDAKTPTVAEAKLTFTDLNLPLMAALTAKQTKIAASTAAKYVGLIKVLKTKAKKDIKDKTTLTTEEEKTKIADFDKMDEAAKAAKETEFATEQKAIEEALSCSTPTSRSISSPKERIPRTLPRTPSSSNWAGSRAPRTCFPRRRRLRRLASMAVSCLPFSASSPTSRTLFSRLSVCLPRPSRVECR